MYRQDGEVEHAVLVLGLGGQVLGMNVQDGTVLWEHRIEPAGEVELAFRGDRVYATAGHFLCAIRYPDGAPLFRVEVPGTYKGRPSMVIEGGRILLATRGEITCFDLDGRQLWHDGLTGRGVGSVSLGFPGNVRQADDAGSK